MFYEEFDNSYPIGESGEEYIYPLDQNSFGIEEEGEIHSGEVDNDPKQVIFDDKESFSANSLKESLRRRINDYAKALKILDDYTESHHCSYKKAIDALGITDNPYDYGLIMNDDGTFSEISNNPATEVYFQESLIQKGNILDEDNELLYIYGSGKVCSLNEIDKAAEGQGLSIQSYMDIHGIKKRGDKK